MTYSPPTISLVTACMNREAHLRTSLPHWLSLPAISEIVIVDWSNATSLTHLAEVDPRIRVIRVEGEPKWILSYAYNIGVRSSRGEVILKCDADCLPSEKITRLIPTSTEFFAGNWRTGKPIGKPSVNGQCVFSRQQFEAVNGYSEFIRTYGRDDEDYYERLQTARFTRTEIAPSELSFIEHDQEARVVNQFAPRKSGTIEELIQRDPVYNELRNMYFARSLPWSPSSKSAPYSKDSEGERWAILRRDKSSELEIPPQVDRDARLRALRTLAGNIVGLPPASSLKLTEEACVKLLANRLQAKSDQKA